MAKYTITYMAKVLKFELMYGKFNILSSAI